MPESSHKSSKSALPEIDIKEHRSIIAMLCYLSVLVIVPILFAKGDAFVKFHIRQGFVLLVAEFITVIIALIPILGWFIGLIAWFVWLALSLMGIWNVAQGKQTELPLVGKYAKVLKL